MIPEKGSSNNNLYIDLPGPSINENNYLYNFYGHDKTDNSKLESDQSSEVDVNNGTKKEEDKPASDGSNSQSNESNPKSTGGENPPAGIDGSLSYKYITGKGGNLNFEYETYYTKIIHEGKVPVEVVMRGRNLESTIYKYPFGDISVGADGSFTLGRCFSAGVDVKGNLIIDFSIPWFDDTNQIGITITVNKEMRDNFYNAFRTSPTPAIPFPTFNPIFVIP